MEKHCRSAKEFVEIISSRGFTGKRGEKYFRGHADAAWRLTPTALREDVLLRGPKGEWDRRFPSNTSVLDQVAREWATLTDFLWRADRWGLPIPEDGHQLREYFSPQRLHQPEISSWPDSFAISFIALAQHHGVPTRLLDWTYSAKVAAYFAATGALKEKSAQMCVWSIEASCIRLKGFRDEVAVQMGQHEGPLHLELATAPASGNPNLKAQQGLFLFPRRHPKDLGMVDTTPFEAHAGSHSQKLVVNSDHAPAILKWLAAEGVDGASLFPGFDGVRKAQLEASAFEGVPDI